MPNYNLGTARGVIVLGFDDKGVTQAQRALTGMNRSQLSAKQIADKTAKGMAIGGAIIAGGLALAVKSAGDFEQEISAIGAVSGASSTQMDQIRQTALRLGKETQFSAGEAAQAIEELVKAGIPLPDVLNGAADATVALAAAGGVSMPEAATISANAMNQFGIHAKDMKGVVDSIAGAANASAIDVSQFGLSLQQVGAVANLAGLNFHDTAVAIAEMGNAGIKGSDAGTSLKTFLQNLIPQTSQQISLFQELGLSSFNAGKAMQVLTNSGVKPQSKSANDLMLQLRQLAAQQTNSKVGSMQANQAYRQLIMSTGIMSNAFFDAHGKTKNLADIQQVLQNATKNMTKEQKLNTLQILFGSDAIRAAAILAGNGAAGYNKMSAAMGKVSAADVARKRMDNFKGSIEMMRGSLETASVAIGEILLPTLRTLVNGITGVLNVFLVLTPTMRGAVTYVAIAAASFLLLGAAIIKMVTFAMELQKAMRVIMALRSVQAVLLNLRIAFMWARVAALEFSAALLTNPVFLIIAAVVALVAILVLLFFHNKAFHDFVVGAWNDVKNVILAAVRAIVTAATVFWTAIVSAFNNVRSAVTTAWNATWAFVAGIVRAAWGSIVQNVQTSIAVVRAVISAALVVIHAVWASFWNTFGAPIRLVFGLIVAIVQLYIAIIELVIRTFVFSVTTLWRTAWNGIRATALAVWNAIRAAAVAVWGAIRAFLSVEWNGIKAMASAVFNAMRNVIVAIWNTIRGPVLATTNFVRNTVSAGFNAVRSVVAAVMAVVSAVVGAAWNRVRSVVASGVSFVLGVVRGLAGIGATVGGYFGRMVGAVGSSIGRLLGLVSGLAGRILGAIGNLGGLLFNAGRSIIEGLLNGIESMISAVTSKLHGLTGLIKSVKGPPEVDRVLLKPAGAAIIQSLIDGMSDKIPMVKAMLGDLTYNVIPGSVAAPSNTGADGKVFNLHVENHNPVPETGSESTARSLRSLAHMGVFG